MDVKLKVMSGITVNDRRVGKERDAITTGKWKIVNDNDTCYLLLEVTFSKYRKERTGETKGILRKPVYDWVAYDVTMYIPENCLRLILTYDNECGECNGNKV